MVPYKAKLLYTSICDANTVCAWITFHGLIHAHTWSMHCVILFVCMFKGPMTYTVDQEIFVVKYFVDDLSQ